MVVAVGNRGSGQPVSSEVEYATMAPRIWLWFLPHCDWRAISRTTPMTGSNMPARMAMIEITTSSSIRVKPLDRWMDGEEDDMGCSFRSGFMKSAGWEWRGRYRQDRPPMSERQSACRR